MRLVKISIYNFKSIDKIENLELLDRKISCLIGKNGSGKSNILYAIQSLKDNKYLNDSCRYEKADKEEEIKIVGEIYFDERDKSILKSVNLSTQNIQGFRISVSKKMREEPTRIFEPIGLTKDFTKGIVTALSKLGQHTKIALPLIKKENQEEESQNGENQVVVENQEITENLEEENNESEKTKETTLKPNTKYFDLIQEVKKNYIESGEIDREKINSILTEINNLNKRNTEQDNKDKLQELLVKAQSKNSFKINEFVEKNVWSNLTINLLDFNNYPIETKTTINSLKGKSHPFFKDALSLSKKTPISFKASGSELRNIAQDTSNKLSEKLSSIWKEHKMTFEFFPEKNSINIFFLTPQKRRRELDDLSDGEKWFLRFYTKLAVAKEKNLQIIWLFDEPGRDLHATSQINLKQYFEEILDNSQIVYTSHQPMMIQWHKLERIIVIENNPQIGSTSSNNFWKDEEAISPLREALGLFIGEQILTGTKHTIVEGISDYIYLHGWLQYLQNNSPARWWGKNSHVQNQTIIPVNGAGSMPLYLMYLAKKTKGKISTIAIPDNETERKIIEKAKKEIGINPLSSTVVSMEKILNDGLKSKNKPIKLAGIEDIFDTKELLKEVEEYYSLQTKFPGIKLDGRFTTPTKNQIKDGVVKYIEKKLNTNNPDYFENNNKLKLDKPGLAMHIYKKLIAGKEISFSKETIDKFKIIFKYIHNKFKNLNKDS